MIISHVSASEDEFSVGDLVRVRHDAHGRRGVLYEIVSVHKVDRSTLKGYRKHLVKLKQYKLRPLFGLFQTHVGLKETKRLWGIELARVDLVDLGKEYANFVDFIRSRAKRFDKDVK